MYYIIYVGVSIASLLFLVCYALLVIDVIKRSKELLSILKAISNNY